MAKDTVPHLKQQLTTPKCFTSEKGTVRGGKEGKIPPHSINKLGRCSVGVQSVGKALDLPQTSRTPNQQTCKSRDDWEAHGTHETIAAGCSAVLTEEHTMRDWFLLLKGINACGQDEGHFDYLEAEKLWTKTHKKNNVILVLGGHKFMKVQRSYLSMHLNNQS